MKRHAPRLLIAMLAAGSVAAMPASAQASGAVASVGACASAHGVPSKAALKQLRHSTLCLVNRERAKHGLRPLRMNRRLSKAARIHSQNMIRKRFFAHGNFVARILNARYARRNQAWSLGENIAWGSGRLSTPAQTVRAWMRSPGHRANILNRKFRDIGVGIAIGSPGNVSAATVSGTYTTDFGTKG